MRGTFRDGDCLFVAAIPFDALQPGDIVAYREDEKSVAHRIVGRRAAGWITQGDGNRYPDRRALPSERLIGRATEVERNGIRLPVVNGPEGLRRARRLHTLARVRRAVFFCLAPPYRLLRALRLARIFWRPTFVQLRLTGNDGEFLKFLHRGRTVACWFKSEKRWVCRKPYDLVLPTPEH